MNEDKADPELELEWIHQTSLIYGGLIGIGVVLIQALLTVDELDMPAKVSVMAFAVAIPMLAALILVNRQESFRRRRTPSKIVTAASSLAQAAGFVGIVAAFWHISWIAGVVFLASGLVAVGVHSAGYTRLEFYRSYKDG